MSVLPDQTGKSDGPSSRLRALHLFTLCAFAFTGPILTVLWQQTVFLHDQGIGWSEFAAVLIVLMFGLPSCCVLLDWLIRHYGRAYSHRGHNAVLFVLSGLVFMSLLRPCARLDFLANQKFAWLFTLALSLPAAWLFARHYERLGGLRHWLTISALGMAVFPLSFVWQIERDSRRRPRRRSRGNCG